MNMPLFAYILQSLQHIVPPSTQKLHSPSTTPSPSRISPSPLISAKSSPHSSASTTPAPTFHTVLALVSAIALILSPARFISSLSSTTQICMIKMMPVIQCFINPAVVVALSSLKYRSKVITSAPKLFSA
jgi:hypothetical protein